MGIIDPKIGLILAMVLISIWTFWMTLWPANLLEYYGFDLTKHTKEEKLLLTGYTQQIGLWLALANGAISPTVRQGGVAMQGTICLAYALYSLIQFVFQMINFDSTNPIGWFDVITTCIVGIATALGASLPTFTLANVAKPTYWGYLAGLVVCTTYTFFMFIAPEQLMKGYGLHGVSDAVVTLMVAMTRYQFAPLLTFVALTYLAQIINKDPFLSYAYARWLAVANFFLFAFACAGISEWGAFGSDWEGAVQGQYFNAFLHLFFSYLFFIPLISMDGSIRDSVEKALAAEDDEEDVDDVPEATETAEPLLKVEPLAPVVSSPPVIQSYAMPSYSYAAAPATTSYTYAAPGTVV